MSELLLQEELAEGQEFVTADSSAALRNDNKGTGNGNRGIDNDNKGTDNGKRDSRFFDVSAEFDDGEDGTPFDKLREECGVMAVYNHADAARLTYWGLYALQHRGQESAGIASADGHSVNDIKGMGLVSEIFTDDVLARLAGHMAIGHTR